MNVKIICVNSFNSNDKHREWFSKIGLNDLKHSKDEHNSQELHMSLNTFYLSLNQQSKEI